MARMKLTLFNFIGLYAHNSTGKLFLLESIVAVFVLSIFYRESSLEKPGRDTKATPKNLQSDKTHLLSCRFDLRWHWALY